MKEYSIELFVVSDEGKDIRLSDLTEKELEQWKEDMEESALSEYYKQKVKISTKK